jgi:transglutaminase-like putative cysteine protease
MRLTITHQTQYHYDFAPKHLIQLLRLFPRADSHQHVVQWQVNAPGKLTAFRDAFGNEAQSHVLHTPQTALTISAQGVVDIQPLEQGRLLAQIGAADVPALAYLVPTALTGSFSKLSALARETLPAGLKSTQDAITLALAVNRAVLYTPGKTDVTSTAEEAYEGARGVCQDHAHVMIAACRSLGVPARYVSGYVDPGNSHAAASHAWVDLWLDGFWHSIDVTNSIFASDAHCRLAIGLDYLDACPIRGVREGGQSEQLNVDVKVTSSDQ